MLLLLLVLSTFFFSCPPPSGSPSRVKTNPFCRSINKPLSLLPFSLSSSFSPSLHLFSGGGKINRSGCVYFTKEDLTTAEYLSSHFAPKLPRFLLFGRNLGTGAANLPHATPLANQSDERLPVSAKTEMGALAAMMHFPMSACWRSVVKLSSFFLRLNLVIFSSRAAGNMTVFFFF